MNQRDPGKYENAARGVQCPTCLVPPGRKCFDTWSQLPDAVVKPMRTHRAHWRRLAAVLGDGWHRQVVGAS